MVALVGIPLPSELLNASFSLICSICYMLDILVFTEYDIIDISYTLLKRVNEDLLRSLTCSVTHILYGICIQNNLEVTSKLQNLVHYRST